MSVAASISGALTRFGRPMTLRRLATAPGAVLVPLDATVYGVVKDFSPNELVGGIVQGDSKVTITNAEIAATQWPGPPRTGDKLIVDGKQRNIQGVEPKYLGSEILVYVCQVRG